MRFYEKGRQKERERLGEKKNKTGFQRILWVEKGGQKHITSGNGGGWKSERGSPS